ncbi:MAG: hypothetical protein IPO05_18230 [Flavobacteriales bacterium]|nr:hypothetical protein [Flavobacteriales bacterium]
MVEGEIAGLCLFLVVPRFFGHAQRFQRNGLGLAKVTLQDAHGRFGT